MFVQLKKKSEMIYVLIESIVLGPEPKPWAWLSNPILDLRLRSSGEGDRVWGSGLPLVRAQDDESPFLL